MGSGHTKSHGEHAERLSSRSPYLYSWSKWFFRTPSFRSHFICISLLSLFYIYLPLTLSHFLISFFKAFFFSSLEREHPKPIVFGDWLGSLFFLLRRRISLLFVSAVFKVCSLILTDLIFCFFFFFKIRSHWFCSFDAIFSVLDLIYGNGRVLCRSVADLVNRSVWSSGSSLILFVVVSWSRSSASGAIYCCTNEI